MLRAKRGVVVRRIVFSIVPVRPFRLDLTVWALRRRPANTIDCWDGSTYRRVLTIESRPVEISVQQHGQQNRAHARGQIDQPEPHLAHANIGEVSIGADVGATPGFGALLQTGEA